MLLIQTESNREPLVERGLTASHRGCTVYFPKIMARRAHARRVDHVERPFIPRYGFVEGEWRVIRTTPGVLHVVALGDKVRRAADEIKAREVGGYVLLDPDEPVRGFRAGDAIEVATLAARGVFRRMAGDRRAIVLMAMLGQVREVMVPLHALVAA